MSAVETRLIVSGTRNSVLRERKDGRRYFHVAMEQLDVHSILESGKDQGCGKEEKVKTRESIHSKLSKKTVTFRCPPFERAINVQTLGSVKLLNHPVF